ncbi:unnamed protein product [Paramecium sonneborni]|uniref:Uncharacterized protein n=1 Tax=Paramecium sonneborni TaxID=65129 RepID=A0A8S1NLM3_9CILI|nr:unnamed protein product [Paramecium sonneborni]
MLNLNLQLNKDQDQFIKMKMMILITIQNFMIKLHSQQMKIILLDTKTKEYQVTEMMMKLVLPSQNFTYSQQSHF